MTRKQAIWTGIAAAHLLMVALSAANFPPRFDWFPANILTWYGGMSGANNSYGFFKVVGSSCKVSFIMTDKEGNSWTDVLDQSGNREGEMRYNGSVYLLPDYGDLIATSWAATMFGRHPEAYQVAVQFEQYVPPTMQEYSEGKRAQWMTTYTVVAVRKADVMEMEVQDQEGQILKESKKSLQ